MNREISPLDTSFSVNAICIPGGDRLFVTTDGYLKICESMDNSFTIGSIWTGFDFSKIKNIIEKYLIYANKFCRKCWAVRLCNLCYIYFVKGEKFDVKMWKENCKKERAGIEDFLKFYIEISESKEKTRNRFKEAFKNEKIGSS